MPPSSGGRGGVVTVNLIFSIDVKKFEQRGGLFEILCEQWIYVHDTIRIHRSLYQIARNAGAAFSIYLVLARELCLII